MANYVNEDGFPRRTGHWRTNAARFVYEFTALFGERGLSQPIITLAAPAIPKWRQLRSENLNRNVFL
jgi:hypothetical protein